MLDEFPETLVNIEWHSPSYTPGGSDFDLPSLYSQRGNMYGVGGIPHSQWQGVENTVGGYPNANWSPMYNAFLPIYNSFVGNSTPYDITINGFYNTDENEVSYEVTVSMDEDMSSTQQKVDIFVVEDNIWSYWGAVGQYHNARNVARDWITNDGLVLDISLSGETQMFTGSFDVSSAWDSENVQIIAVVQNYSTPKQVYQVAQVNINDMDPDVDDDGIMNGDDNCMNTYNPYQSDVDGDGVGDACDECNDIVYVLGNINGDADISGDPIVDIYDILTLSDVIGSGETNPCMEGIMNINGDGSVNAVDVWFLIQIVINGTN